MKNKLIIIVGVLILTVGSGFIVKKFFFKRNLKETKDVYVVPTMQDEIAKDASWCATFELVWNDMKNEVVKKDIVFNPEEEFAKNLNKEEFSEDMLSDEYYYKAYGLKTLDLKKQIEEGIKETVDCIASKIELFTFVKLPKIILYIIEIIIKKHHIKFSISSPFAKLYDVIFYLFKKY